jgi:hypothetical protein
LTVIPLASSIVVVAILSPNWWRSRFPVGFVGFSELHAAFLEENRARCAHGGAQQEIQGDFLVGRATLSF